MKKTFFLLFFAAFFFIGSDLQAQGLSQLQEGGWLVGASSDLSFSSTSVDGSDQNISEFNLGGKAGYFVMDGLAAGIELGLGRASQGDLKSTGTLLGLFGRYYIQDMVFAGLGYGAQTVKFDNGINETKTTGGNVTIEAGYPIWLFDVVAVEPALRYMIGTGDFEDTNVFELNVGLTLYFR